MLALLRCHRDHHIWLYVGGGNHIICPKCRTSVAPTRKVEIIWDVPLSGIKTVAHHAGKAIPMVNNWNGCPSICFMVVSDDGKSTRLVETKTVDTGIEQETLISNLRDELGVSPTDSGHFDLPKSLHTRLKRKMDG